MRKAIALGMEILLRVPHFSFVLQGEDTINFKITSTRMLCFACLPRDDDVADVVAAASVATADVVATAAIAGIVVANANPNVDDACSDVDALPHAFAAAAYVVVDDANADAKC